MAKSTTGVEVFAFEVYTAALALLPTDYDKRHDVAAIAAAMSLFGENPKVIADQMRRSESYVRQYIVEAKLVFDPHYAE